MSTKMSDLGEVSATPSTLSRFVDAAVEEAPPIVERGATEGPAAAPAAAPEGAPNKDPVEELVKTPHQYWLEELDKHDVTPEETQAIVDQLLTKGFYEETYRVRETMFAFRTRTTRDADRLMDILLETQPDSQAQLAHTVSRVNLAASLSKYGKDRFELPADKADDSDAKDILWKQKYRYMTALPEPLFYMLGQVLTKFDNKVRLAGDARSIENF